MLLIFFSVGGTVFAVAAILINVYLFLQRDKPANSFDRLVRPLMVRRLARRHMVPSAYVQEALHLQDGLENNQLSSMEYLRAAHRLGEQYPEEYKRMMESI